MKKLGDSMFLSRGFVTNKDKGHLRGFSVSWEEMGQHPEKARSARYGRRRFFFSCHGKKKEERENEREKDS